MSGRTGFAESQAGVSRVSKHCVPAVQSGHSESGDASRGNFFRLIAVAPYVKALVWRTSVAATKIEEFAEPTPENESYHPHRSHGEKRDEFCRAFSPVPSSE